MSHPRDLHDHVEIGRPLPGIDALQRGDVGVVAAGAHTDVLLGDPGVVGGVVVPPATGPGLNPRVASPVHGIPDDGVAFGVQVAGHVKCGNSHAAQQNQRQVHEVLADAPALVQRVEPGRVHTGGPREVVQLGAHPLRRGDDGFGGVASFGDLFDHGRNTLVRRRVRGRAEQFVETIDDGRGLQVAPGDLPFRWLRALGLDDR